MNPNKYLATALAVLLATQAPAAEEEKEEWNVNAPPGDSRTIEIDTRTGTWMSLDVSPDGNSGLSWSMQPRFSPDGSEIA